MSITIPRPIIGYSSVAAFPAVGVVNTIYIDLSEPALYIWNGSSYELTGTGITISLEGEDYLSLADGVLTANPIDLASSNVEGLLPATNINLGTNLIDDGGQLSTIDTPTFASIILDGTPILECDNLAANAGDTIFILTCNAQDGSANFNTYAKFYADINNKTNATGDIYLGVSESLNSVPTYIKLNGATKAIELAKQITSTGQPVNIRSSVSATQTINNNTPTAINVWDTSVKNQGDITHSGGVFTVGSTGLYLIFAVFSFPSSTTGVREIYFTINGSGLYGPQTINGANSGVPTRVTPFIVYPLTAGDTVTANAYQTSGGNQACGGGNLDSATQMLGIIKLF